MNFQGLSKIESPKFYLDLAYRKATKKIDLARGRIKKSRFDKSKQLELIRIEVMKESLVNNLMKILTSFPSIDGLPKFYNELVKITIDYEVLKKSLGAVNWCIGKTSRFYSIYNNKIRATKDIQKINQYRREFNGRVSSLFRQIKDNFAYLEESRRIMKAYPALKTSAFSVVIVGFPNVGKTTLLYKLTGSKPEINSYPFTTKNLNLAYIEKIQLVDVPGTLGRFEKMNDIEKQAYLALRHCCDLIVYIMDLTEPYSLEKQIKLLDNLKQYNKEIIIYLSKKDIIEKKKFDEFTKKHNAITDAKTLTKKLISSAEKFKVEE